MDDLDIQKVAVAAGLGIVGAIAFPVVGVMAGALVPAAMSIFGTVTAGVGTMHAPLVAGGVAATLQATSAALVSTKAAGWGAWIGVRLGLW